MTPRFAAIGLLFKMTGSLVCLVCMLVLGLMRLSLDMYIAEGPELEQLSTEELAGAALRGGLACVLELEGLPVVGLA